MKNILRLAAGTALSRDVRQRWRQVSVIGSSIIVTITLLGAVGLLSAVAAAYDHSAARSPQELIPKATDSWIEDEKAPPPDGAAVRIVPRGTIVDGKQVPTVWIDPLPGHEDDPAIVPPGLTTLPGPGEAALSPGLLADGHRAEHFGWTTSDAGSGPRGTIGDEGLMTASEPLVYVRPAQGRSLDNGTTPIFATGFGSAAATADAGNGQAYDAFALDPEALPMRQMLQGLALFVALPSIVLMVSGARARSAVRDHRLALLVTFGIRERTARSVLATETALLSAIGIVVGAVVFALVSPHLSHIPHTSISLLPGTLGAPWWTYPLVAAGILVTAGACGALGRIRPNGHAPRGRRPRLVFAAGLAVSLTCVLASALKTNPLALVLPTPQQASSVLFGIGTFGTAIFTPLAIPALTWLVAGMLRNLRRPAIWAAGRRLRFDAVRLSRIASTLSLLIVLVSVATATLAASRASQTDEAGPDDRTQVSSVSWRDPSRGDLARAEESLKDEGVEALVLPIQREDDSKGPAPDTVVVDDCRDFATFVGKDPHGLCTPGHEKALADQVQARTGHQPATGPGLDTGDNSLDVLVLSHGNIDPGTLQRAWGWLPGLNLDARSSDISAPYPIQQWLTVGALVAFAVLGIAAFREIGDRLVEDAERDRTYLRIGLGSGTVDMLGAVVAVVPLLVGSAAAFVGSVLIAYGGQVSAITKGNLGELSLIAATTVIAAGVVVVLTIPSRRAMRIGSPDR
jgi:hypothetical protein